MIRGLLSDDKFRFYDNPYRDGNIIKKVTLSIAWGYFLMCLELLFKKKMPKVLT